MNFQLDLSVQIKATVLVPSTWKKTQKKKHVVFWRNPSINREEYKFTRAPPNTFWRSLKISTMKMLTCFCFHSRIFHHSAAENENFIFFSISLLRRKAGQTFCSFPSSSSVIAAILLDFTRVDEPVEREAVLLYLFLLFFYKCNKYLFGKPQSRENLELDFKLNCDSRFFPSRRFPSPR